eukprot:2307442-Lingulodinium_polyedra.AAC.1
MVKLDEKSGTCAKEHGASILANGAFGADFAQMSSLAQIRLYLMRLPSAERPLKGAGKNGRGFGKRG